jgi:hypothetical protein
MKYIGLNRDVPNSDMPEGFGIDAKNGINSKLIGAAINEGGFKAFQKKGTNRQNKYALAVQGTGGVNYYRKQCGEVQLDKDRFLIFSVLYNNTLPINNATHSEIGLLDEEGKYIPLIRDILFSSNNKLNFSLEFPVTGDYTKNYLGQTIVAATDYNNKPMLINVDNFLANPALSNVFNINSILMFPDLSNPNTNVTSISDFGGNLPNGTYYLVYKYYTEDFAITNGLNTVNPIYIYESALGNTNSSIDSVQGDLEDKITSKSINITLTGVNTTFKGIKIYAIIKRQGVLYGKELKDVTISGNSTINVTLTNDKGIDVDYKSLITPTITFTKVYAFTQVVKRLYAARVKINQFRDFQKYANKVRIKWVAKQKYVGQQNSTAKHEFNHIEKTFQPREVYAFYIHLELIDGTITEGFHIPALSNLTEANIISGGYRDTTNHLGVAQDINCKRFQVEDTCSILTPTSPLAVGEMGLWENTETYPNLPEYDSSGIGGIDLRNKPIRHHRFPSINFFRENLCFNISPANNDALGITWLPTLGIKVENVDIPNNIKPFVKSWFISYAKRDYNNSTVIGSSAIAFQSTARQSYSGVAMYDKSWYSGANYIFYEDYNNSNSDFFVEPFTPFVLNRDSNYNIQNALIRFYDLNLLKNTPDINPVFISNELLLNTGIATVPNSIQHNGQNKKQVALTYDYSGLIGTNNYQKSYRTSQVEVSDTNTFTPNSNNINIDVRIRKINSYKYLVKNSNSGNELNELLEDTLLVDVNCSTPSPSNKVNHNKTFPIETINTGSIYPNNINFRSASTFNGIYNQTYLSFLMALPNNVYENMFDQTLVNTGIYYDKNNNISGNIFKGDCFNTISSFHTTGWGGITSNNLHKPIGQNFAGVRALWVYPNISLINYALRTSNGNKPELQFYPKNGSQYHMHIDSYVIETNKQYNMDYSSINDIKPLLCYNPYLKNIDEFPYRIHRTIAEQSESTDIGWKTWLVNDYYEIPRNKGVITNIQGVDRNLIINTENSTFITVGNEQLNIGNSTAFIGAGNIFERPAMEYVPSKEGSIGNLDRFSCLLSSFGYLFVDRKKGAVVLIGETPQIISLSGMSRWLFENLDIKTRTFTNINRTATVPDNPYSGFGIHCGIDYEFNRFIITKKYYELTEAGKTAFEANVGTRLRFENNIWVLYSPLGTKVEVGYDNTTYFINKSFTISYDISNKVFTYFHDYFPIRYMVRRQSLIAVSNKIIETDNSISPPIINFSFIYSSNHFIMNQDNKGIYENTVITDVDNPVSETATPYEFSITPVIGFKTNRVQLVNLSFQTDSILSELKGLGAEGRYQNTPPTTILVFNSYQSTPIQNTVVLLSPSNLFSSNIRLIKGLWNFNKLKDWLAINVFNSGQPFITEFSKLDTSKIDLNKPKSQITPLVDQWFAIKLSYNNALNLQKSKEFRILHIEISILPVTR